MPSGPGPKALRRGQKLLARAEEMTRLADRSYRLTRSHCSVERETASLHFDAIDSCSRVLKNLPHGRVGHAFKSRFRVVCGMLR